MVRNRGLTIRYRRIKVPGHAVRTKRVGEFKHAFREAKLRRHRSLRRQRLRALPIERHHVHEQHTGT
jgi:hypothetical protein